MCDRVARHSGFAGAYRAEEKHSHVIRQFTFGGQYPLGLRDGQFLEQRALLVLLCAALAIPGMLLLLKVAPWGDEAKLKL